MLQKAQESHVQNYLYFDDSWQQIGIWAKCSCKKYTLLIVWYNCIQYNQKMQFITPKPNTFALTEE